MNGRIHRLRDYHRKIVIVNFWSAECPHSERTDRRLLPVLERWGEGTALLSLASNANESPAELGIVARSRGLPIILVDAGHAAADLYEAQTTPHVFVIDRGGVLRYRGAVDDVTFRQRNPSRFFLEEAVEALLGGHLPALAETPAYGCAIVREP